MIAILQSGGVLYDQTYGSAFSSAAVQSAIGAAEGILSAAGAASFIGPRLESTNQTLLSSTTSTMQTGSTLTNTAVNVTTYIGPQTIYPGDYGVCQTYTPGAYPPVSGGTLSPAPFDVPGGGEDIDTFVVAFYTVSEETTTTNTYDISQVYDIVGVPEASLVPEPQSR